MGMNTAAVQRLYVAYFNRPADPVSLAVYEAMLPTDREATQAELLAVAEQYFSPSAEYTTNFEGKSNTQIVDQLYQNIFGRSAEADGLISWATKLTDGSITVAELALQLSFSAQGTDATVVNARIDAAVAFTNGLDTAEEITGYSGNAAAAEGRAYLAQISGTLPTTDEAITAQKDSAITNVDTSIAAAVAAGSSTPGSNYAFTTGTDKFDGTNNDDTYNGLITGDSGTGTTMQAGDQVLASGGTDTLAISISGTNTAAQTLVAVDAEVEKVLVSNFQTADDKDNTIDTTLMGSLTTVGTSSSAATGDTIFTGLANLVNAEMKSGAGDLTVTYNGAGSVAGSADAMTLTAAAQTGGTFTADGIENLTVNSTIATNTVTLASDALKSVTVTGSAALNLGTLNFAANGTKAAPGAVVDASAATGAVTLTTTASEVFDVKGGSGNDTFTLGSFTANDIIDGGKGSDTAIAGGDTWALSTLRITDVETLQLEATNNADLTVNAAGATSDTLRLVENNTTSKDFTVTGLDADTIVEIANNVNGQAAGVATITLADPSGSADAVNVAVSGTSGQGAETIEGITLTNVETVNLESKSLGATAMLATDSNVLTTLTAGGSATTVNISGSANLTITNAVSGAKVTTIDGSTATGNLGLTAAAVNYAALKTGSGNDTIAMGTTLTAADSIDGGGNTGATGVDTLTATVNALGTSTAVAALNIDNVETVTLEATTAASYIDLTGSTGVTTLNVGDANGAAGVTLSVAGMAGNTTIGLGGVAADDEFTGTLIVNLADETGSADNVEFVLAETGTDNDVNATLQVGTGSTGLTTGTISTGVEKVTITVDDQNATGDVTLDVTAVASAELEIKGGAADGTPDEVLTLGTLNAKTVTVDASTFKGALSVTGSNTATNMTVKQGAAANTIVLGTANDTLTLADLEDDDADGGAGTGDTLNATIDGNETEDTTNFEIINYTIGNNVQTTITGANGKGVDTAVTFNLKGGDALTTWAHDLVSPTALTTYNMAGFGGSTTTVTVASTAVDLSAVTLTGSAGADTVSVTTNNNNFQIKSMTGVETLAINAAGGNTTFDVSKTSGLTTIKTDDDGTARDVTLTDLSTGTTVDITTGITNSGVIIDLAEKTATDNALTVKVGTTVGTVDIDADEVETVTINSATGASTVDLAGLSMTTGTNTLKVTGNQALTISALHADTTTIDASGMTTGGSVIQTGRSTTAAVEYTGSSGNDTFIMANTADVIKAGAGTDTLDINTTAVLGGIVVDLSATDVVAQANGSLNTTEQSGFINVDLAGYAGGYGAVVTANKAGSTIVGTSVVDQISGGAGVDTITGGDGDDVLSGGGGADTFVFNSTQAANGTDTISDFLSNTDIIDIDVTLANLRGTGAVAQRAAAGAALNANAGLVISSADIANAAGAETYAEGLTGEAAGDIVYLLGSTDADSAAGVVTLYRVDYAGAGDAAITTLGTFTTAFELDELLPASLNDYGAIV